MVKEFIGTGASEGYVCGPAVVFRHEPQPAAAAQNLGFDAAMKKFYEGRYILRDELLAMAREAGVKYGSDKAGIYEGYAEILMDDEIEELVKKSIMEGNAPEQAAQKALEQQARELEALENGIMKERGADFLDLSRRLAAAVSGSNLYPMPVLEKPCILVTDDLSPFETIQIDHKLILGLAMDRGASTGHVAILARSLGIPCVVALDNAGMHVSNETVCALDGSTGSFIIEPDAQIMENFKKREENRKKNLNANVKNAMETARTKDGKTVMVCANINFPEEAERAVSMGADGVGLYRTEFFYMNSVMLPTEEEQFLAYSKTLIALEKRPLTIRTLDMGGDKDHPCLGLEKEQNPFLGYRGIRFSLNRPEIFKPQIRAVVRAAALGKTELMFPMVVSVNEFKKAAALVDECRAELAAEGIQAGNPCLGIMVETPAAAIMAQEFADVCDFFSLGTNDLAQYILAADRGNSALSEFHSRLDPAVLRLMAYACDAAVKANIQMGICGELAADLTAIPLLVGLGITKFSVSASRIPAVKAKIRELDSTRCKTLVQQAIKMPDIKSIYELPESMSI
ncbi:MAG: phosphoenolpyruvate--protein phosphotransferase [Treponema sp.]|nr:phosphoenolpyruvate--protein phosphotransferase [Treponema sp.]